MNRERCFTPSLVHGESSETHVLGACAGKNMPRDSAVVGTAQPGAGTVTPPVHTALDSAPHPQLQQSSSYPAGLAEAPLEERVEGGRVPPPTGQTAGCGTDRHPLSPHRDCAGAAPPLHPPHISAKQTGQAITFETPAVVCNFGNHLLFIKSKKEERFIISHVINLQALYL